VGHKRRDAKKENANGRAGKRRRSVSYDLFLRVVLLSWGEIPNVHCDLLQLKELITDKLVSLSASHDQWNFDPEVPDSFKSVLIPMLESRGVDLNDMRTLLAQVAAPLTNQESTINARNGAGENAVPLASPAPAPAPTESAATGTHTSAGEAWNVLIGNTNGGSWWD